MAGQGLNLGLGDVQALSEILVRAVDRGQDIGNIHVLREYNQQQMVRNLGMMGAIDGLWKLFHAELLPLRWLRSTGLNMLNGSAAVKVRYVSD